MELENRIGSLHRLRKHVQKINSTEDGPSVASNSRVAHFRVVQRASQRLHEVLSSSWSCESLSGHSADICLDLKDDKPFRHSQNIRFDLMWSCPTEKQPTTQAGRPLQRLWIETFSPHISQCLPAQQELESALRLSFSSEGFVEKGKALVRHGTDLMSSTASSSNLTDLRLIPNLCRHLTEGTASTHCIGYFQENEPFSHLMYAPQGPYVSSPTVSSLEDALMAAKGTLDGIPLPEKFALAKLLALAVLRFHSTPWLNEEWRSSDVVFFGIRDFSQDSLCVPFLKSHVFARARHQANELAAPEDKALIRSPIRNRTLYNFGVLLIELAYNSPLHALVLQEDDQGDPYTLYWTAMRLGEKVRRELGPFYADAVNICLHCGFGASSDLQELKVQRLFFDEVVQNLQKCAEAVTV